MNQGVLNITLYRDGTSTPWGFRLQGGYDLGTPLVIQRVFLGSPSESELHRGDVIMRVGNRDANKLSHQLAHDLIKNAGNSLHLVIQRFAGDNVPISPVPASHPANRPLSISVSTPPVTPGTPTPPLLPPGVASTMPYGYYRPLPMTKVHNDGRYQPFAPEPQNLDAIEKTEFIHDRMRENQAIANQAYRTFPLIGPKAKTRHDIPIGSYMRHVTDPTWKTGGGNQPNMNRINDAFMLAKVQESVVGAAQGGSPCSMSPGQISDRSGPQLVNRQYNTPIQCYSNQAIMETISNQTGLQPNYSPASSSGQPSPRPQSMILKDFRDSPTCLYILEEEMKGLDSKNMKECRPVQNKVYTVPAPDVNTFGMDRGRIHQSHSFNVIKASVLGGVHNPPAVHEHYIGGRVHSP